MRKTKFMAILLCVCMILSGCGSMNNTTKGGLLGGGGGAALGAVVGGLIGKGKGAAIGAGIGAAVGAGAGVISVTRWTKQLRKQQKLQLKQKEHKKRQNVKKLRK